MFSFTKSAVFLSSFVALSAHAATGIVAGNRLLCDSEFIHEDGRVEKFSSSSNLVPTIRHCEGPFGPKGSFESAVCFSGVFKKAINTVHPAAWAEFFLSGLPAVEKADVDHHKFEAITFGFRFNYPYTAGFSARSISDEGTPTVFHFDSRKANEDLGSFDRVVEPITFISERRKGLIVVRPTVVQYRSTCRIDRSYEGKTFGTYTSWASVTGAQTSVKARATRKTESHLAALAKCEAHFGRKDCRIGNTEFNPYRLPADYKEE